MSTHGIRNNGINRPIASKEAIPIKKKGEKLQSGETASVKDSFAISDDGMKLDKVFKDLANVKSFIANTSIDSEKLIQSATNGLKPEFLNEDVQEIGDSFAKVIDETLANPKKAFEAQGNLTAENVLKLELPEIKDLTDTFNAVENFISANPELALKAQANLE